LLDFEEFKQYIYHTHISELLKHNYFSDYFIFSCILMSTSTASELFIQSIAQDYIWNWNKLFNIRVLEYVLQNFNKDVMVIKK